MSFKKHRKIFYVPGMISLVVLPLLCFWFIFFNGYMKEYRSFNYGLDEEYSKKIIKEKPKLILRNNSTYVFNSSIEKEQNKLDSFQLAIRKLHQSNDSINGIKVHFGKQMNYEVFIRVLDIQAIEKTDTYYQLDNDLYVLGNRKIKKSYKKSMNYEKCFYYEANKDFFAEQKTKANWLLLIKNLKQYKIVLFAFIGIIILNIFVLLKFNRNRKYNQKSYL
ncbi:hypothetical protein [Flavobacterium cheonanense]